MEKSYKYDIAFSFLASDEKLAQEINDLLSDRYKTFLYSERQTEISGADGEVKFKKVFAEEARFVVVLYRASWGATTWTRMEEEAIRDRAYTEGYDFAKFIPLDEPQTVPVYVPKVNLWINALRFGAKGAAASIEGRLEELGVTTQVESVVHRAARLQRENTLIADREKFRKSHEGVTAANSSFVKIGEALRAKVKEIVEHSKLPISVREKQGPLVVTGLKNSLCINWRCPYNNTLEDSYLDIEIWNGPPPVTGAYYFDKPPHKIKTYRLAFGLLSHERNGWLEERGDSDFDAAGLAEHALKLYMDKGNK